MRKDIIVAYGSGENKKNMCVVNRVTVGFRAGYRHVKVDTRTNICYYQRHNHFHVKLLLNTRSSIGMVIKFHS